MAPAVNFFAGQTPIFNTNGSGLGFFGSAGFGASIPIGQYNLHTYITNTAGTTQGAEGWNVSYYNSQSGIVGQASSGIALTAIPNYQGTLQIRFTNDTAVTTQNVYCTIYDGYSVSNLPSGVTVYVAELVHPTITQTNNGSGSTRWYQPAGSSIMSLTSSPGASGLRPGGASTSDNTHDTYLAISVSPTSVGSKQNVALYFSTEYL